MKKFLIISFFLLVLIGFCALAQAQCSICTRTASQLGEQPAKGLNFGIVYLAFTPFVIVGFIAYQWWRRNHEEA